MQLDFRAIASTLQRQQYSSLFRCGRGSLPHECLQIRPAGSESKSRTTREATEN